MWDTLKVPGKEWRRLYKGVNLAEHLLKFGAPQCVQEIRDEAFKIRQLVEFSYMEDGTERGQGSKFHLVRDKARLINILVSDFQQLEAEREAARQLSNRYVGISSDEYYTGGGRAAYASSSAPSAYQPAPETVSQRSGLGAGPASSQWNPNSRGFESPQYTQATRETQGGLFEPPRQAQGAEGLFQPPRQPVQEYNIFDPKPQAQPQFKPQPVDSKPPAAPSTDIFSLSSKPKTDLFSLPKPTPAHKDPPSDLLTLPKPTPTHKDPPSDLFSIPKPTPAHKDPPSDLFSIPKSQSKSAAPQVRSEPPPLSTPTPAVIAKPTSNPSVISALDGLFTAQPANKPGIIPKPGQYQGTVPHSTIKIHHNMEASPMPTLSELKITPSLAQPATAPPPPKRKSGDLESFLVDLDNLKIEGALDKRENTHVEGFGVASGKRA